MPIYTYQCPTHSSFDALVGLSRRNDNQRCPKCPIECERTGTEAGEVTNNYPHGDMGWVMTETVAMARMYMSSAKVKIGDTVKELIFESCFPVVDTRIEEWIAKLEANTLTVHDETIAFAIHDGERQLILGIEKL